MSEYCTLFCSSADHSAALAALTDVFGERIQARHSDKGWDQTVLRGQRSSLTLNRLERQKPMDQFSKLILSIHNFVGKMEPAGLDAETIPRLRRKISECVLIIGVVADPDLDANEGHQDAVLMLASRLDALIFNGSAILDSSGETLARIPSKPGR